MEMGPSVRNALVNDVASSRLFIYLEIELVRGRTKYFRSRSGFTSQLFGHYE